MKPDWHGHYSLIGNKHEGAEEGEEDETPTIKEAREERAQVSSASPNPRSFGPESDSFIPKMSSTYPWICTESVDPGLTE